MPYRNDESETCSDDLRAISGAFAMIAFADGHLADSEVSRFQDLIRSSHPCEGLDVAEIERGFFELARRFSEGFAKGKKLALDAIFQVKNDPVARDRVVAAAQVAIVADGHLDEAEEAIFKEICRELDVDPDEN